MYKLTHHLILTHVFINLIISYKRLCSRCLLSIFNNLWVCLLWAPLSPTALASPAMMHVQKKKTSKQTKTLKKSQTLNKAQEVCLFGILTVIAWMRVQIGKKIAWQQENCMK